MDKPTLIYVYDPLCGWCYGFYPVIGKIKKRFEESLSIKVIPGGLAVGENAEPIGEGYGYIKDAGKQVEEVTGAEFGTNFKLLAEEGSYLYDSLPPSIAQITINKVAPEFALEFSGRVQNAFFRDGKNLNNLETYLELIKPFPVDDKKFKELYESDEMRNQTLEQFDWCKKAGATGFPALLLLIGDDLGLMSKGYKPYDTIESHLHHLLRNYEKLFS